MGARSRSVFLASLVSAVLLVSVFAVVQAQEGRAPAVRPTNWSAPATWPNGKVPVAGDAVTIPAGKEVVLDVSPPALGSLSIDGKLSFANNRDLELTTEWILLHGELEIGTEAKPHTRKATITFTNNVKDEDIGGMGRPVRRPGRRCSSFLGLNDSEDADEQECRNQRCKKDRARSRTHGDYPLIF